MKFGHLIVLAVALTLVLSCTAPIPTPMPTPTPAPSATPTPAPTPTPTPASAPKPLPLIDAHNHLPRGVTLDYLIELMDGAGVQMTLLMPVYYSANQPQGQGISDENLVLAFYKQEPNRIIPFLGMQRQVLLDAKRWQQPDVAAEDLLRFAESQLRTGLFKGMGEFILWHYPYSYGGGNQGGAVKIPADTPLMRRFLDLAANYHVPVTIHYEIDEESLPSLKRMLEYGRKTAIILAHNGGRPDHTTLKALLDEYPNVFCDLGAMTRLGHYGYTSGEYKKNPIEDGTGHLLPQWRILYEQYADRFILGTDMAHPEPWANRERYKSMNTIFRSLLSDLSAQAAEKIAFRNAQKFIGPAPRSTPSPPP